MSSSSKSNADWLNELDKFECRDSTYRAKDPSLVFARAKGSRIWDAEGREYIDLCAGFGVTALGHNNDVQKRVFSGSFNDESLVIHAMGDVYPSVPKIELLSFLAEILPPHLTKGALSLSGGQAVEIAVKTAQIATKKSGFITFEDSYHGLDLGILPLTSRRDFKENFLSWMPTHLVSELGFGAAMVEIERAMDEQTKAGHGTAAVIVEAVQGRAGIRPAPEGWLLALSELCKAKGVLLIFDEVFTGLGRIGSLSSSFEVEADLICLGKALGGGLPLSVCFGREEVMNAWPENMGEAIHTGTFFGHPLSCRLGLETLKVIVSEKLWERSKIFGARMVEDLKRELDGHPRVVDVRGLGMMIGIELDAPLLGATLMDKLRAQGLIALASGTLGEGISLTPALTLSEKDWLESLYILKKTMTSL